MIKEQFFNNIEKLNLQKLYTFFICFASKYEQYYYYNYYLLALGSLWLSCADMTIMLGHCMSVKLLVAYYRW